MSASVAPVKNVEKSERSELVKTLDQYKGLRNEWLKRQIIEKNRIDILATHVLGYTVEPFHMAMMMFQFQHPDSLQLAFRGAGKTTVCTIAKAIHFLLKNPNLRILIASKTSGHAEAILKEIKSQFEENDPLAEIFGAYYDPRLVRKWDNSEIEVLPRTTRTKEASITTLGVGKQVVGKHYDIILSDDLVDEENSRTEYMRDKTQTWYYQSLDPTLEPPDPTVEHRGEHHRLGTRYHYSDLYGHLSENELKDHTNVIPALDQYGRSPWPTKFTPAWFLEKKKKSGLIIFNAQYQCHSEDTEFLTENGWMLWENVKNERLATVNVSTGVLEYQQISGRTKLPFDGHLLKIKSKKVDAMVTPNHRMLAKESGWDKRSSPPKGPWEFVDADSVRRLEKDRILLYSGVNFIGKKQKKFHICCGCGGRKDGRGGVKAFHPPKNVNMDCFVKFIGFFVSEGSTTKVGRGGIRLDQNEGGVLIDMKNCLHDLGFDFKENKTGGCVSLDIRHIGLWRWLRKEVKTKSCDAKLPRFVFKLSTAQRQILLDAMISGDGHIIENKKQNSFQYTTTSKQLADDVQELATTLCYDATLLDEDGSFCVCIRRSIGNGIKANQIKKEHYVGNVVCFSVKNKTLITRKNGRVLISGNCDTEAMKGEIFQYDECQLIEPENVPKNLRIFMGVDLAISEAETADQFAIVVLGMDPDKNRYILDFFAHQLRFGEQTRKIVAFYEKWSPIKCCIEINAYQKAQYHNLQDEYDIDMRLKPVHQDKDKITRAWKLESHFEKMKMFFKKGGNIHLLIEQLVLFPNYRYKDLFDALDLAVRASKLKKKKKRLNEPGLI